jgi:hypothetical protein
LDHDQQAWGAQNTAGRGAQRPAQSPPLQQAFGSRPAQPTFGQPQPQAGYPQQSSAFDQAGYNQPGYSQPGAFGNDPASALDAFAALRADPPTQPPRQDYQYQQQPDPFASGQYALPQQQPALSTYQPRTAAREPSPFESYAQPAQSYSPQPAQQTSFGAATSYPAPPADAAYAQRGTGFDASGFDNWSATQPHADAHNYQGGYDAAYQQQSPRTAAPAGTSHWVGQDHYGHLGAEQGYDGAANYGHQVQPQAQGSFDQTYADDEEEYEAEPQRRGWKKIGVLLASTVMLGGGLAYAYSSLVGGSPSGAPPVVKSADGPVKVKPSDPGGKQFAHTDSKVMGRLAEGSASNTETSSTTPASEPDSSGARKVPVLVVGRDGSIQPPPAPSDNPGPSPQRATVAVPGLTVIDGFGGPRPQPQQQPRTATVAEQQPARPLVVSPPAAAPAAPVKPKVIAAATPTSMTDSGSDGGLADADPAPPAKKAPVKKTAALAPSGVAGPTPTGAGYVAVIASVPASASSRIDALKQFADMQQKYGSILQNKTPDVQEANLGEKGTYHRLLVGPPGSRDSASQLCSELKGQGYSNCWVTAY